MRFPTVAAMVLTAAGFLGCGTGRLVADNSPPSPQELAARAALILGKRCTGCHGTDPAQARGRLNLLDQSRLVERDLVIPSDPGGSELIARVEDGSMPPLDQPPVSKEELAVLKAWVQAGAAPFTVPQTGTDYIQEKILEDVMKLPVKDRPFVRYFSLNHLLADERTRPDVDLYREALSKILNQLSHKKDALVQLRPIEATQTLLAVDLGQLGWDKSPFDSGESNWFDLVLLEYPYAVIDTSAAAFAKLVDNFLEPARQVRPILFVRGDWFLGLAIQPAFYQDLLQVPFGDRKDNQLAPDAQVVKAALRFFNTPVTFLAAKAELGAATLSWVAFGEKLAGPPFQAMGLAPLAGLQTVIRQTWEAHFLQVARDLGLGIPIQPIDAVIRPELPAEPTLDVEFKTDKDNNVFPRNSEGEFLVLNKSKKDLFIELMVTNKQRMQIRLAPRLVEAGRQFAHPEKTDERPAKDLWILLACEKEFQKGVGRKGANLAQRVVHDFYKLQRKEGKWDIQPVPGIAVKKVIECETR